MASLLESLTATTTPVRIDSQASSKVSNTTSDSNHFEELLKDAINQTFPETIINESNENTLSNKELKEFSIELGIDVEGQNVALDEANLEEVLTPTLSEMKLSSPISLELENKRIKTENVNLTPAPITTKATATDQKAGASSTNGNELPQLRQQTETVFSSYKGKTESLPEMGNPALSKLQKISLEDLNAVSNKDVTGTIATEKVSELSKTVLAKTVLAEDQLSQKLEPKDFNNSEFPLKEIKAKSEVLPKITPIYDFKETRGTFKVANSDIESIKPNNLSEKVGDSLKTPTKDFGSQLIEGSKEKIADKSIDGLKLASKTNNSSDLSLQGLKVQTEERPKISPIRDFGSQLIEAYKEKATTKPLDTLTGKPSIHDDLPTNSAKTGSVQPLINEPGKLTDLKKLNDERLVLDLQTNGKKSEKLNISAQKGEFSVKDLQTNFSREQIISKEVHKLLQANHPLQNNSIPNLETNLASFRRVQEIEKLATARASEEGNVFQVKTSNETPLVRSSEQATPTQIQIKQSLTGPNWSKAFIENMTTISLSNKQSAEIRLDPPDLGPIQVKIQHLQGETQIQFQVQHADVKNVVEMNLSKLREALAEQGLDNVNIELSQQGKEQDNQAAQFAQESEHQTKGAIHESIEQSAPKESQIPDSNQSAVDFFA